MSLRKKRVKWWSGAAGFSVVYVRWHITSGDRQARQEGPLVSFYLYFAAVNCDRCYAVLKVGCQITMPVVDDWRDQRGERELRSAVSDCCAGLLSRLCEGMMMRLSMEESQG